MRSYAKVLLIFSLLTSSQLTYAKTVKQSTVFSRIDKGVKATAVSSGNAYYVYENLIKQIVYHCSKGQKDAANCKRAIECYKKTANGINAYGEDISTCDQSVGTQCMMIIHNSVHLPTDPSLEINQEKLLYNTEKLCPREKNNSNDNCTILYNALKACTELNVSQCNNSVLQYVSVINEAITSNC